MIKFTILDGHCAWSPTPFFQPPKKTFKCVLQNQVQINYDDENDEYNDDNGDNIHDYDDENNQKLYTHHDFLVKLYPF